MDLHKMNYWSSESGNTRLHLKTVKYEIRLNLVFKKPNNKNISYLQPNCNDSCASQQGQYLTFGLPT